MPVTSATRFTLFTGMAPRFFQIDTVALCTPSFFAKSV